MDGINLDMIPDDAVGIYSPSNDNPLQYRFSLEDYRSYSIEEKSNTRLVLRHNSPTSVSTFVYIGGIVSPDGNTVYWVNNTRPLP